ncbi:MAG: ATP-binding protein [Tissierellaceae bacterium]|nr:ATP-binding protein [Tissierellaceae bacterium]
MQFSKGVVNLSSELLGIQETLNIMYLLLIVFGILIVLIFATLLGIISGKISLRDVKKLRDINIYGQEFVELQRQDRIRTLGELTASIVHDIGNPLAGMGNLVEILKDEDYADEVKKEVLDVMSKEIDDLNDLIINYLDFSRESKFNKEQCDIMEIFNDAVNLLKYEMDKKSIKLNIKAESELPSVSIDRRAMKQVIINIMKNSIEALNDGGLIDIFIDTTEVSMKISIKDNGYGIDNFELENIFDPFYTTKKGGTGLGLSTVYKTIVEHDGEIKVNSILGSGTEFIILLPLKD